MGLLFWDWSGDCVVPGYLHVTAWHPGFLHDAPCDCLVPLMTIWCSILVYGGLSDVLLHGAPSDCMAPRTLVPWRTRRLQPLRCDILLECIRHAPRAMHHTPHNMRQIIAHHASSFVIIYHTTFEYRFLIFLVRVFACLLAWRPRVDCTGSTQRNSAVPWGACCAMPRLVCK